MIFQEKIILFIFTLQILFANTAQLEFPIIPKIDCQNLTNSNNSSFIAFNNSNSPRTIFHLELSKNNTNILWEYSMPENKKGYFIDVIINDFDNNGSIEMIATAFQDGENKIFYIFNYEKDSFTNKQPIITGIKNRTDINNPRKMYLMSPDINGKSIFLLSQGSPNRQVLMCDFIENQIIDIASIGNKFLNNTLSAIDISLGDFDGDGGQDIFILDKGFKPSGYFIYSNGNEEKEDLSNYPRLKSINQQGVDINFDGSDDLIMLDRNNQILSDIWGDEPLSLLGENNISNIIIKPENGILYLKTINNRGQINSYSIDPLSKNILSNESSFPSFNHKSYKNVLVLETLDNIILVHNDDKPELWSTPLYVDLLDEGPFPNQLIYDKNPDFIINIGEDFFHPIKWDSSSSFRNFNGSIIPENMNFDVIKLRLNWKPKFSQLGYHQLSYKLDLRDNGPLEINLEDGKIFVSQSEPIVEKIYSYLLYVNNEALIDLPSDSITIVNRELFNWIIPIKDKNADAQLSVGIITGSKDASLKLIKPNIKLIANDTTNQITNNSIDTTLANITNIKPDTTITNSNSIENITTDTLLTLIPKDVYVDSIQTDFEDFVENKIEAESDPFKKKKQESSVEEFRTKEEEYREKLKTHKKVLKDGKNIWILKDSLSVIEQPVLTDSSQTLLYSQEQIALIDSTSLYSNIDPIDAIEIIGLDSLSSNNDDDIDNIQPEIIEVSYKELIQHQAEFSWFPNDEPGKYNFTIFVSDNYTSDTSSFIINLHPEIDLSYNSTNYSATVNKMFNTTVQIKQFPKSNKYNFQLINAPDNLRIDTTGTIYWVPLSTQVDDYKFSVDITDGIASSTIEYNIFVNAPPVIASRPSKTFILPLDEKLTFVLEGFDLNSIASLSWKLINGPASMSLTSEGVLTWEGKTLGHHPYSLQLSDGIDSVQWEGSIYVNSAPIFTSKPVRAVIKNNKYEYHLFATDENIVSPHDSLSKNKIEFSLVQGPDSMQIDENNILFWDTKNNYLGEYMVAIVADDGADNAIQVFPIFINSFPIITSVDSIAVQIGDTLDMQIEAYDPNEEDNLTFHFKSLPNGLTLEINNGMLRWFPQISDIGPHKLALSVKDGHDNIGTEIPFTIFVYQSPILTSKLPSEAFIGLEYSAILTAEDLYGEKLSKAESIKIDTASFNYYNLSDYAHLFKWTPREVDKGNHQLVIKLTDKYGFSSKHIHNLNVFTNPCIDCNSDIAPNDSTRN